METGVVLALHQPVLWVTARLLTAKTCTAAGEGSAKVGSLGDGIGLA